MARDPCTLVAELLGSHERGAPGTDGPSMHPAVQGQVTSDPGLAVLPMACLTLRALLR